MHRFIPLIIISLILFALEWYVYQGIRSTFPQGTARTVSRWVYLFTVLVEVVTVVMVFIVFTRGVARTGWLPNLFLGLLVTFFITKLTFAVFLLGEDVYRIGRWVVEKVGGIGGEEHVQMVSRRKFLGQLGLAVAAVPFTGFLYGMLKGKYDYKVRRVPLAFSDLPEAFDGFRIVQISDVHSGSFDNAAAVQRGLEMIMEVKPDVILFTGDMVNNVAEEIEPFMDMFSKLAAPHGKFSVLGNHDYGDYYNWESLTAKQANLEKLKRHEATMGFEMLHNRHIRLEKGNQSIVLAGVENWGNPPFPQHGDLEAALQGLASNDFTVLMSHDPSHWDAQVREHPQKVHLTLSGHTHGMQMGVEIPGFRWSPVKWRYNRWADLYQEAGQYLYVNRGFGFIGYPGRVGIWPEITLLELQKA